MSRTVTLRPLAEGRARSQSGGGQSSVNAELNRVSGIMKISDATVEQLDRRLDKAGQWLRRASACRVVG